MEDKGKNLKLDLYNISPKTGLGTIGIYYSKKGKVKRFPSSVKCSTNHWDRKKNEVKKGGISESDKAIVDTLYNKVSQIITDHQFRFNELPSVDFITDHLDKPEDTSINVHDLYEEFINDYAKDLSNSKKNEYSLTGKYILTVDKMNKYNLNLYNFNYSFLQKFKEYMKKERGNKNRSINIRITNLITFANWINRKEIKNTIKTELWQKLDDNSVLDVTCLERKELDAILNYEVEKGINKNLERKEITTRDLIITLSHTGMRCGDLKQISRKNIVDNCLEYYPKKTRKKGIIAIVPITKPVREILEKYNYKLPQYSDRVLNEYIREFCGKIKLLQKEIAHTTLVGDDPVTEMKQKYTVLDSHAIGRKTFINLCIEKRVQLTSIAGMTGHTKIDTIMKFYADKHANKQTALSEVFKM